MVTENITLLEFVNKHFKHYDVIYGKEDYDSLEIRVKDGKTGRMIVKRTSPYDIIHNTKHRHYQKINVEDLFQLVISYNNISALNDCLVIRPYIVLWSSRILYKRWKKNDF